MNRIRSTAGSGRDKVLVRDVADIRRLNFHLLTRWTLPRVEIRIESLPAVVVQHAQHRMARISETCNCVLGVLLAAMTMLGGSYMRWASLQSWIWTSRQFWQHLVPVAMAALCAGLTGWVIEVAWTRIRLTQVLRRLRRRLVTGKTFDAPKRYTGRAPPKSAAKNRAALEDDRVAADSLKRRPPISRPGRPKVLLRDTADMYRLVLHLFTHWRLPRVEISVAGIPAVDVQRAQHRIAHLSEGCNCVLAAWLAATTILIGSFSVEWISSHHWEWWVSGGWGALGLVAIAALCASFIGWAIEMVWTRVRLMLVLRGVRHRLGA